MKRRNIILAAISALVLLVAIAFGLGLFSSEPSLNVHLRCDKNVSGKLSVAMILPDGSLGERESFDLETICRSGDLKLSEYKKENKLQFIFDRDNGQTSKLTSKYGSDIVRDQHGFYMILKITNTPPFIANDRL